MKFEMRGRPLGYVLASALLVSQGGQALAADDSENADLPSGLDQIVVVAQKREQNLQDVPVSITALTSSTLETSGVGDSILNLATVTPGYQATQVVSGFIPRIRGVGSTDSTPGNESSVSVYVDGVYIPGTANGLVSLSNIERIEVLKGPQGTLFGRNSTGGLIHIITKKPSSDTSGKLKASYGNFDTKTLDGYVTTGIAEGIAIDFAGHFEKQDNFWGTNLYDGSGAYRQKNHSFRSRMLLDLSENTEVILAGDYYKYERDVAPFRIEDPSGFYNYNTDLNSFQHGKAWGFSGKLEHDFGGARLVSISAYRHIQQGTTLDIDLSPAFFQHAFFESKGKSFSQEIQLLSPQGSKLDWIVGGFFFYRTAEFAPAAQRGALLQMFMPPLDLIQAFNKQKTTSYSAFAQATYPILENTNLTAGIRYTKDIQKLNGHLDLYPTGGIPPVISVGPVTDELRPDKVTYRLSLDHHFSPELMAYVSFNTGYKSGFFSISGFPAAGAQPETLTAYEAGIKAQLFNNRVRLNVAAYYYDYKDVQSLYIDGGASVAVNAPKAKITGIELDSTIVPVDRWHIRFGFNWMPTAKYKKFPGCPGPKSPPWVAPGTTVTYDCSGSRMINAPKWDIKIGTDYTVPTGIGDITLAANYQYLSKFPWDADFGTVTAGPLVYNPNGLFVEKGYSLVNAQAKWTSKDDFFNVTVWGKNLSNTKYLVNGTGSSGRGEIGMPGSPRTYGVTVGVNF